MASSEIRVGVKDADVCGDDNRAIQQALDAVAAQGGGRVIVGPGVYRMDDSLHLRSGVEIVGSGHDTVLRKAPEVRSELSADLGYGHYDVSLADADRFRVGMGVLITDSRAGGFYTTVATLTWREGDRFGTSRMLNHDYARAAKGRVISLFPVISGSGIEKASVANLAVDANRAQNPDSLNGCRGGGVFLIQSRQVALRGLHVAQVNGDGISFQQCDGTRIEDCVCEDNTGLGLHPGSGSVGAMLRRCTCRRNGADGIFYCLRVTYSVCEDCLIADNGGHGISIGGRDTGHLIRNNVIRNNGGCGIYFREHDRVMAGNRNRIQANEIAGNCLATGAAEIHLDAQLADVHVLDNRIQPAARIAGIRVAEGTERVVIDGNQITAEGGTGILPVGLAIVIEGDDASVVHFGPPPMPLAVGPDSAPSNAARHLGPG